MKKFAITAVKYDDHPRIEKVEVRKIESGEFGNAKIETRERVIKALEAGNSFVTARKDDFNRWVMGDDVGIVKVAGNKYIRTDGNSEKDDNLGKLPEF